MGRMAEVKHRI